MLSNEMDDEKLPLESKKQSFKNCITDKIENRPYNADELNSLVDSAIQMGGSRIKRRHKRRKSKKSNRRKQYCKTRKCVNPHRVR